jgi:hypothetical protein
MVSSNAKTVEEYLESLPEDRRAAIAKVRMQYGMIGYYVPLEEYPDTYNGQPLGIIALASQKNYMSLYLMSVYGDSRREKAFVEKYKASGKKLDMGKSCVRFKTLDDLPLDLVAETVASVPVAMFIGEYEESRAQFKGG